MDKIELRIYNVCDNKLYKLYFLGEILGKSDFMDIFFHIKVNSNFNELVKALSYIDTKSGTFYKNNVPIITGSFGHNENLIFNIRPEINGDPVFEFSNIEKIILNF